MTDPSRAPTVAQIALGAAASGAIAALAAGVRDSVADYVLPSPPDLRLPKDAVAAMSRAAAHEPAADAFRLVVEGLPGDPAWRGRRCRSHEGNLESLRFANIIAPGGLLIRREALLGALHDLPPELGADGWRTLCRRLARDGRLASLDLHVRRDRRMEGEPACPGFAPLRPCRVLVLGQIEVSTSLYFDFLENAPDIQADFRALTRLDLDAPALAAADLVILVRELHRFWDEGVIAFLGAAGVPYVYFTDDNFPALRAEGGARPFFALPRMRTALAGAAAVWTSTDALAAAHLWQHGNVSVWPPVLDAFLGQPPSANPDEPLVVAIAGGDFRLHGVAGPVLDRLREIAEAHGLRLVVSRAAADHLRPAVPRAEFVIQPIERSFRQFIHTWRCFAPDILLHPAGATANAPFKSPTAAIVASYLGAVPVVADEPAYHAWDEAEGLLRLGAEGQGLAAAALNARQANWRAEMGRRLAGALVSRFAAGGRSQRLLQLARRPQRRNAAAVAANILDSPQFARGQARRRLIRLVRPLLDRIRPPR